MAKSLTIELSDAAYEALRAAAEAARMSPEQLVANTLVECFDTNKPTVPEDSARDRFIQFMRERGAFVDPAAALPPHPPIPDMPKYGTPEWYQMVEEIGDELSDAAEAMGIDLANLSDLVER